MKAKRRRSPPPVEPWTQDELAEHLAKIVGAQFSTGPVEDDAKREGTLKFWVMLPGPDPASTVMAIVRVSPALHVSVDMAQKTGGERKIVTVLRASLEALAKPSARW